VWASHASERQLETNKYSRHDLVPKIKWEKKNFPLRILHPNITGGLTFGPKKPGAIDKGWACFS